jgi:hypothetical protein
MSPTRCFFHAQNMKPATVSKTEMVAFLIKERKDHYEY